MRIMLCVPTFVTDNEHDDIPRNQQDLRRIHIANFKTIIRLLRERHDVYCALDTYHWKKEGFAAEAVAVETDWAKMQIADHVIACPVIGGFSSLGVHVEIGWATALGRPVTILVHQKTIDHTVMVVGLENNAAFDVSLIRYDKEPLQGLDEIWHRIGGKTVPSSTPKFTVVKS